MKTYSQVFEKLSKAHSRSVDLSKFNDLVGEDMPEITPDKIGKFRVYQILRRRFGVNFKNHPAAKQVLTHFENEVKMNQHRG